MRSSKRWYVVQTKGKQEEYAADNLREQGLTVFAPKIAEQRTMRGIRLTHVYPLFPNYIFLEVNIKKTMAWRSVQHTRGVVRILTATQDSAVPLPKGFVESLRRKTKRGDIIHQNSAEQTLVEYLPGQEVLIKRGIFEGKTGTYVSTIGDNATIILALLAEERPICLPLADMM